MKVKTQFIIETDTELLAKVQEFADVHTGGDASAFITRLLRKELDPIGFQMAEFQIADGRASCPTAHAPVSRVA